MMYSVLGIGAVTAATLAVCTLTCTHSKNKPAITDASVASVTSCIFCQKSDANKRSVVDAQKIGETRTVRILLDTVPMLPGHLLLTPSEHRVRAHELTDTEVLAEHEALKQIVAMYKTKYNAENYLILQKNGKAAGQSVPHYHKHIYPIASKSDFRWAQWNFATKFFTFGLCSTKLKGEKLATLQRELTPMIRLTDESAPATSSSSSTAAAAPNSASVAQQPLEVKDPTDRKESDEKAAVVASCVLCPASTRDATPSRSLVEIVVQAQQMGPGHVIIKTTRHVEKAHERTPEEVIACHRALQKVARIYKRVFGTDDYVQIQENGRVAGQEHPHFHTHLYAVPKTKHEYLRQMEALVKYTFASMRSFNSGATAGSEQEQFIKALAAE